MPQSQDTASRAHLVAKEQSGAQAQYVDKFEARRRELADATLETLGELGYARTSLREIAQNTRLSHGSLHYYFRDKLDLITFGVRRYNARCTQRYDAIIESDLTAAEFTQRITDRMVETMWADTAMHKLWYDMRTQAMFEPQLAPAVAAIDASLRDMVWRITTRYADLCGRPTTVPPELAYAVVDGLFESCLFAHVLGDKSAEPRLRGGLPALLRVAVPTPS